MTGWNLPSGVNMNDLPGNRPEDLAEEEFWANLEIRLETEGVELPEGTWGADWFVAAVGAGREMGWHLGYDEGRTDSDMARGLRECDHKWRYWNELGKVICRDCGTDAPPEVATPIMAGEIDRLRRRGR